MRWTNSVLTSSQERISTDTKYLTAQRQEAVRLKLTTARLTSIWRDTLGPAVKLGDGIGGRKRAGAGGAETPPFAPRRRAGGYLACPR